MLLLEPEDRLLELEELLLLPDELLTELDEDPEVLRELDAGLVELLSPDVDVERDEELLSLDDEAGRDELELLLFEDEAGRE